MCDNRRGVALQQQAAAQDRGADTALAQHAAETEQIGVHQRLAAGEHHPLDTQALDIGEVALEIRGA